jgi:membrane-associated protease RseP (regulator of RpoE activity)
MNYLVLAIENNPEFRNRLRTYSLHKSQVFYGYGIAFHTEAIQPSLNEHKLVYPFIEIESDSPAENVGMKYGQRVVAVNGAFVNREFKTIEDIVAAIEDSYINRDFTDLTVLEPETWLQCMEEPMRAAELAGFREVAPVEQSPLDTSYVIDSNNQTNFDPVVPRLCRLARVRRGEPYGFDFKTLRNEGRHIANNVKPNYPAHRSGLRDGDYILEVNGEPINGMEHETVVNRISQNPTQVDLLVVGDLNAYLTKATAGNAAVASSSKLNSSSHDEVDLDMTLPAAQRDVRYHKVNLIPGVKSLGISLFNGGKISNIDPSSASDRAGLRAGDKIVEVNGIDVRDKSNKEIAKIIKENEQNLIIGVISADVQQQQQASPRPSSVGPSSAGPVNQASSSSALLTTTSSHSNLKNIVDEATQAAAQGSVSSATGKHLSGNFEINRQLREMKFILI